MAAGLPSVRSTSFDKGLAGIGWAVNLLNEAGYIAGNIDEILCDVDAAIYKTLTSKSYNIPLYSTSGLVGYLAYLSCRLGNPNHRKDGDLNRFCTAALRITIDKIQNIMPSAFSVMSKDLYITALWEFPLLFVLLRKALELGVYSHKISSMVNNWEIYMKGNVPYYNVNKLMLATSMAYLNEILSSKEIERQIDILVYSVDFDQIEKEIDDRIENVNEGWFLSAFVLYRATKDISRGHMKYGLIEKTRKQIVQKYYTKFISKVKKTYLCENLSLVNGLAGVTCMLALCPDAFEI